MSGSGDNQRELVVLGAGPAGLGAAYRVSRDRRARVTVLERSGAVGGNAGSFEIAGLTADYGSHRLHPASDPEVLDEVRELLGDDLLDRPRHGRIRLLGRWIHFPLKPLDLAFRLPPSFAMSFGLDSVRRLVSGGDDGGDDASFATVLEARLGRAIAGDFYLPYARKIWGLPPEELSPIQARRRVSADSPLKLVSKVLKAVPGFGPPGAGRFFYPRGGFGQISEGYRRAAEEAGARVVFGANVTGVEIEDGRARRVLAEREGQQMVFPADHVWSTIPITVLARCVRPQPAQDVLDASRAIRYRSMLLVYLVLDTDRFTEFDAHYFPEESVPLTRLSEPKNYAARDEPRGRTVLCAEVPCATDDPEWAMSDDDLARSVADSLEQVGLPLEAPVIKVATRRLPQAYPIYRRGYEVAFERLDAFASSIPNLLSFGRQGLFAHDNTHHALYMAYCASRCLAADGEFDDERWAEYRKIFETHVVED